MRTHRLLRNIRHRAMITPVRPLRTRIIYISPSYWTVYHSFEIILEWDCPLDWNSKSMFYAISLLQKHSI